MFKVVYGNHLGYLGGDRVHEGQSLWAVSLWLVISHTVEDG